MDWYRLHKATRICEFEHDYLSQLLTKETEDSPLQMPTTPRCGSGPGWPRPLSADDGFVADDWSESIHLTSTR